jgi:hypothetical protein
VCGVFWKGKERKLEGVEFLFAAATAAVLGMHRVLGGSKGHEVLYSNEVYELDSALLSGSG